MATYSKQFHDNACACGCEGLIEVKRHHKYNGAPKYLLGHNTGQRDKGKPKSEIHKQRLSEAQKNSATKYWLGKKRPSMQGVNNHNWKGGVSPKHKLIRASGEYKAWRESVFKRDGWTCACCSTKGGDLHPHHIKNFSSNVDKRFDMDNGVTLCKSCHSSFHSSFGIKNNNSIQLAMFFGGY